MASTTGWVWDERYAWHDARGMMDTVGPEAMFEPEPSLESGAIKRRLREPGRRQRPARPPDLGRAATGERAGAAMAS